jgi:hypothetical protein
MISGTRIVLLDVVLDGLKYDYFSLLKTKDMDKNFLLGIKNTTNCTISPNRRYIECAKEELDADFLDLNFLSALTLAWAYILSSLWIESQGGRMQYTAVKAAEPSTASTSTQLRCSSSGQRSSDSTTGWHALGCQTWTRCAPAESSDRPWTTSSTSAYVFAPKGRNSSRDWQSETWRCVGRREDGGSSSSMVRAGRYCEEVIPQHNMHI